MSKAWPVTDVDPDAPVAVNAARILRVRIGEFYAFTPAVHDPEAVQPLHDLRIAAKRLRYTLELFRDVFGEAGETQIERIKEVQELLGQIHDTDVRIELIEEELVSVAAEQTASLSRSLAGASASQQGSLVSAALRPPPDDPRRGLLWLLGRQYAQRTDLFGRFTELWDRLAAEGMRQELVALSCVDPSEG